MKDTKSDNKRKKVEKILGIGPIPWDQFEAGIYNYCDHWCEKCPKTTKCFAFYEEQIDKDRAKKKGLDIHSWESTNRSVADSLAKTGQLLAMIAEEEKLEIEDSEEDYQKYLEERKRCDPSQTALMSQAEELPNELLQVAEILSKSSNDPKVQEAEKVLSWYSPLIRVKTSRAIRSRLEADFNLGTLPEFDLEDSLKTAQLVHRSIQKCLDVLTDLADLDFNLPVYSIINNCTNFQETLEVELIND